MKWITGERPNFERLACSWLIKNHVDSNAEFCYVPTNEVLDRARVLDAITFDIPNAEYHGINGQKTFDSIVDKHGIHDPGICRISSILRYDEQKRIKHMPGLFEIADGLNITIEDDIAIHRVGIIICDALYNWAIKVSKNSASNSRNENSSVKRIPSWVPQLKIIITNQFESGSFLSLKEISEHLRVHPSYLSRKFSEYFDNMNFTQYMRKLRLERALSLIKDNNHSLAEVALLSGFSDQSHLSRTFKTKTGLTPNEYRKQVTG